MKKRRFISEPMMGKNAQSKIDCAFLDNLEECVVKIVDTVQHLLLCKT